jgi:hypothetical protein
MFSYYAVVEHGLLSAEAKGHHEFCFNITYTSYKPTIKLSTNFMEL